MKRIITCLVLLSMSTLALANLPASRHIVVTGQGQVEAVPDIAIISLTVEKTAESLSQAKDMVDEITARTIKVVAAMGIEEEDITASDIQAHPQYEWTENGQLYKGEFVSRNITIKLSKIEQYSKLVQAVIKAGISRINDIQLDFSKREQLEAQAMENAITGLKTKAQNIASAFNSRVGKVYSVVEAAEMGLPMPQFERLQAMKTSDESTAAESLKVGKQRIYRNIQAVFYLED